MRTTLQKEVKVVLVCECPQEAYSVGMLGQVTTDVSFSIDCIFLVILEDMVFLQLLECICHAGCLPLD